MRGTGRGTIPPGGTGILPVTLERARRLFYPKQFLPLLEASRNDLSETTSYPAQVNEYRTLMNSLDIAPGFA
jgi:hypothetical protein